MAKIELKFLDVTGDGTYLIVEAFNTLTGKDDSGNDTISIAGSHEGEEYALWLDKSTAIKLAKTLRTEINKISEGEVDNG